VPHKTPLRVLVVDDDLEMAAMVADELGDRGYTAVALRLAREAVELLTDGTFDALITDLRMPHIDGLTLLRASRALDPSRPVIVMTGHMAIATALEAVNEGAFHYVIKPFNLSHLVELLEEALQVSNDSRHVG